MDFHPLFYNFANMLDLLKLRFIQVSRFLKEIGWFYSILFFSFLLLVLTQLYNSGEYLNAHQVPRLISIIILWIFIVSIHFKRPDRIFLDLKIKYYYKLYIIEYILISTPIILWYLLMGWYYEFIIIVGANLLVPFLPEPFWL